MPRKFRRTRVDVDSEMDIAIGCIVSTKFCRDFKQLLGGDFQLFKSKSLKTIVEWCVDYYEAHEKAPEESIMNIFKVESQNIADEDQVSVIEETLVTVNNKFILDGEKFDVDYVYKNVELYIKGRSLEENCNEIKGLVSQNRIAEAEAHHAEYKRKEKGELHGLNLLKDLDAIDDVFVSKKSLFPIPGAFGQLVQEVSRGDILMAGGASKSQKSWYCMKLALYAIESGLKCAFFSVEMSEQICSARFSQMISKQPLKDLDRPTYVPYFDENNNICYSKENLEKVDKERLKRRYRRMSRECRGDLVIYDATTGGNSVSAIKTTLMNASEYDGIDFDVVIVDQLNLLKPSGGLKEKRHQLDSIAIDLKREIAQGMNTLVITPVQYNRSALNKDTNGEEAIQEAYSLFSHASLLISINRTEEEREKGVTRITCTGRHADYSGTVVCLHCLDKGDPLLDSRWLSQIPNFSDIVSGVGFPDEDELLELGEEV